MAEIEDVMDTPGEVDSSFIDRDFSESDPPSPEEVLAKLQNLINVAGGDPKEALQKLLKQKLGILQEPEGPVEQLLSSQFFVLLTLLLLIASVFVFFGYKLYKSLKEKERKRDEKKKLRQQKKRK